MSIANKIDEIRKKPEYIRLRYVWLGVIISMVFILIIWIFSLQETFRNSAPKPEESASLKSQWESTKENMPSIEEFMENNPQDIYNNEIAPQDNANNEAGANQ